jgi:GTP cyclohydrolase IA
MAEDPRELITRLLEDLGEDVNRPGLVETPERVIKAWRYWLSGMNEDPLALLKTFEDTDRSYDELVFQGGIPFVSHCEHHMTPFFGVAHVGYIPSGPVVGLSKLARVVDVFSRRLQMQERMTVQIAETIFEGLKPLGVGVVLRCRHMCIEGRGIRKPGTMSYTSSLLGCFRTNDSARSEFLRFVERSDAETKNM